MASPTDRRARTPEPPLPKGTRLLFVLFALAMVVSSIVAMTHERDDSEDIRPLALARHVHLRPVDVIVGRTHLA